jgi:hypothetical protein
VRPSTGLIALALGVAVVVAAMGAVALAAVSVVRGVAIAPPSRRRRP